MLKMLPLIRLEQLYPFPIDEVAEQIKRYKNAEFIWCQEEPKNMGAWMTVRAYIDETLENARHNKRVNYVGRLSAASPATGFLKVHNREQEELVNQALS